MTIETSVPKLFDALANSRARVVDYWINNNWQLIFEREPSSDHMAEACNLFELLSNVKLAGGRDGICWHFNEKVRFMTKAVYLLLT